MKVLLTLISTFLLTVLSSPTVWADCSTAVPSTACSASGVSSASAVTMCFKSVAFMRDNGSCGSDKTADSCWDRDSLFTTTNGVEFNILNLGSGVSLDSSSGVTMGSLRASTAYPCSVADVTSIVITNAAGSSCDATALIDSFLGATNARNNMYMRGSDDCPGGSKYPSTIPIRTTAESSATFKFNVQFTGAGPQFIFKPTSGGAEIDTSNIGTVTISATGAGATGNVYCGAFTAANNPSSGGSPDGGGGQGSVSSGTATCSLNIRPGTYKAGVFQDVTANGAHSGPGTGDLICLSDSFTVTAGATTTASCALVSFASLFSSGSSGGSSGSSTSLASIAGTYVPGTQSGSACAATPPTSLVVTVSGSTVSITVNASMAVVFTGTGSLTTDFTVTSATQGITTTCTVPVAGLSSGKLSMSNCVNSAGGGSCAYSNFTKQ